ncbi:MAG: alkaline phosphatase family protein [Tepidiformaceae bacterium]
MAGPQARVLMVGLDAMEWTVLERLLSSGKLPNLEAFATAASRALVRSDAEGLHGTVWPTFATGKPPGEHGVYFWTQWLAEEMRHVRNSEPQFENTLFWAQLAAHGMHATVIDVPHIQPLRSPGFRTITAWGLHDESIELSHPPRLLRQVRKRFGGHPLMADTMEPASSREKLQMSRELARGTAMRARLARDLAARRDWELLIVLFAETHKAGHYLSIPTMLAEGVSNEDAMLEVLRPLDHAWPRILEAAGADCGVFLFSPHGMVPQVAYSEMGPQILDVLAGKSPDDPFAHPDLLRRLRELVPDRLHRAIWHRLPASVRNAREGRLGARATDFKHDRLFAVVHDTDVAVRVNQRGRERDGLVPEEEAAGLLNDLEKFAAELLVDDGAQAFPTVLRASDFPGPRSHRLPDMLLLANRAVRGTSSLHGPGGLKLQTARPEARNGSHTGTGFCYYRGQGRFAEALIDNLDFAPTILALLGVEPPAGLAGVNVFASVRPDIGAAGVCYTARPHSLGAH